MRLLLLFLMIPTVTGAQLRGQSEKVTTFAGSLELVTTKTAYAVMTFGVMYRERRIVMPARLLYRGDLIGGLDELNVMFGIVSVAGWLLKTDLLAFKSFCSLAA